MHMRMRAACARDDEGAWFQGLTPRQSCTVKLYEDVLFGAI